MLLSEIVKEVLLEGKASSFLKFYNELGRGYDPDDAILFDCLTTLKEYYESYMKWYDRYPTQKKIDVEVVPHFQKRLNEILIALQSDDKKKQIIAIDNGINQWHIDMPIIRHLQFGCDDGGDAFKPEEKGWVEVEDLLIKLGRIKREPQFKRIYETLGWGGMIRVQNYWVNREGKGYKVGTHGAYASLLSKEPPTSDEAFQWMFDRGWARISMENNSMFISTSLKNGAVVDLSKAQREWVKMMRDEIYPGQHLEAQTIYGRPIEI